jgi:magnesium-transporting ATPase (P-type)
MYGIDRWTVVFALCFLLFVLALRSIWRSARHSRKAKVLWSVLCLVPFLGPTAWFAAGTQREKHR